MTDTIGVLHVDDDTEFAERAADHFGRTNHPIDVHIEERVSDATDRLETESIDCVVSAFDLPGGDGLGFLQTVRNEYQDLPFVLCTDPEQEAIASDAFMIGATDCLVKGNLSNEHTVLANRVLNYAEKARAERRGQRRLDAIDATRDGIGVLDEDGTFRSVNEAYANYFGYEPRDITGNQWDLIHPAVDFERVLETRNQRDAEVGERRLTATARHADGSTDPVDLTLSRGDTGAIVCLISDRPGRSDAGHDHREADSGAHHRELQRYRNLLDTVHEPVCIYDETGRFEVVNEALAAYFDTTPTDLEGQTSPLIREIHEGFPGDPITELATDDHDEIAGEFEMDFPGRGERILEYRLTRLVVDGTVDSIVAVARDTTERKRREAMLTELHQATRTFMEAPNQQTVAERAVETAETVLGHSIAGIWLSDATRETLRPVAATDEKLELIGDIPTYSSGDGLTWQAFESGDVLVTESGRNRHGPTAPAGPIASEILLPLGEYGVLSVGAEAVDAFGDIDVSLSRVLANTTEAALDRAAREDELRAQQFELERQNERLEEFASILSHDLRNPLQVFRGVLDGVETDGSSEHVERGHRTIDRMETMIDDLLALARQGNSIEERDVVDLPAVAEACWQNVETGDCTLQIETERSIEANELRLKQLLENLFDNAVEHGSTNPDSQARQDAEEQSSSNPPSSSTQEDTAGASSGEPSVANAPEDAVEHGSTNPDSQARQDAAGASSGEPSVANAPEDAVEHGSTNPRSTPSQEDAVEHGGEDLTITVGDLGYDAGFFVEDDGSGIPDSEKAKVFERGYSTSRDGIGFGLAIVQQVASAHGWELQVTESDAGGARFEIRGVTLVE